jgi:ABC-type ATPase with predicted acetyltransferase domain
MKLSVSYDFVPKQRSVGASVVMDHFGVDFEQGQHVVADQVELPIQPGQVVLFVGPSGSGKSSLLRAAAAQLGAVRWLDQLQLPEVPLADALPGRLTENFSLLAACGLGEAQLLLRTPSELSEGQRYRFRLALGWAECQQAPGDEPRWLAADEFSATLDRVLAKVVSYNLRRLVRSPRLGLLLATTHEDVLDDLDPDVVVRCDLDGRIEVTRPRQPGVRPISFFVNAGAARAPSPIGRTSRGGIIAATTSPWCGA